jgi:hypothetical protein
MVLRKKSSDLDTNNSYMYRDTIMRIRMYQLLSDIFILDFFNTIFFSDLNLSKS